MIHKTNVQMSHLLQNIPKSISAEDLKLLLAKYSQELLSKLQKGDLLEGKLLQGENNKHTLLLKEGGRLPITLLTEADFGKDITLIVEKNEKGKVELRPFIQTSESIADKVASQLQLPNHAGMKEWIHTFMEHQLPIQKEAILQSHYLEKHYELPKEVITQFLGKAGFLDMPSLEKVGLLRNESLLDVLTQVKQIMQKIEDPKILDQIYLELEMTKESELEGLSNVFSKEMGIETLKKEMMQNQIPQEEFAKNQASKEYNPKEQTLKEQISNENIQVKTDFTELALREKKQIIEQLMDKKIIFNPKSYENANEGQKVTEARIITDTYKILSKVINVLEKATLPDLQKEALNTVREVVSSLGMVNNQANYFLFPMNYKQQQVQAEVYFFKPKKHAKKNKSEVYAVVALDLSALRHIEVHVKKQNQMLELMVHTENVDVQKHMISHMPRLQEMIEGLGYTIVKATHHLLEEREKKQESSFIKDGIRSLDVKA